MIPRVVSIVAVFAENADGAKKVMVAACAPVNAALPKTARIIEVNCGCALKCVGLIGCLVISF